MAKYKQRALEAEAELDRIERYISQYCADPAICKNCESYYMPGYVCHCGHDNSVDPDV